MFDLLSVIYVQLSPNCDFSNVFWSFSPSYEALPDPPKPWDNFSSRRPAITGILVHWPSRLVTGSAITDDKLNFQLSVKWSAGAISDQSMVQKFRKAFTDCTAEDVTEIVVEPPVELTSGASYCITLEVRKACFIAIGVQIWSWMSPEPLDWSESRNTFWGLKYFRICFCKNAQENPHSCSEDVDVRRRKNNEWNNFVW